jgi:hypothetical protein
MRNRKVTGGILGNSRRPKSKSAPVPASQWLPWFSLSPKSSPPPAIWPPSSFDEQWRKFSEITEQRLQLRDKGVRSARRLYRILRELKELLDEIRAENERDRRRGAKVHQGARRGAAARDSQRVTCRNLEMAREYREKLQRSALSSSALKTKIGKKHGLSRSQSIAAIDRALKEIVR